MKSRLLSTAAALFLLLGLVSTSAFAQISSSASVDFYIRSYNNASTPALANDWHNTTATTDTVGHKFEAIAQWTTSTQSLGSIAYQITFPKGTVVETNAADSVYIRFYPGSFTGILATGNPQEIKVSAGNISINANSETGYSATAVPTITVTDNTILNSTTTVQVVMYKGLKIGSVQANVNASAEDYMIWKLNSSSQASTIFTDSSSLRAMNDLAAGVKFNTGITAYIDGPATTFPSADTVAFIDRFGNLVPSFPGANDSIQISVASGAGWWNIDSTAVKGGTTDILADGNIKFPTATDSTVILLKGLDAAAYSNDGYGNANDILHIYTAETYDYRMLILGTDAARGSLGLAFNGTDTQDSTTFTFTIKGPNKASGTLLGTAAANASSITRARLTDSASKQIGSVDVAWTTGGITYVGGLLNGTLAVTVKNIFGENFADATVLGTGTDSLVIGFAYVDSGHVIDQTKTSQMANGKTVSSQYSMPATTLNYVLGAGSSALDHVNGNYLIGGAIGNISAGTSTFTMSAAATNLPVYYGMASHASSNADSIAVVIYAKNNVSKIDTFFIRVEPGSPVAFDLDTLAANLSGATLVKGAQFPVALPMIALDTAYNRVYNLNINSDAATSPQMFETVDPNSTGSASIFGLNFKIDGRDPLGYDSDAITDSIRIDSVLTGGATEDSSYIATWAKTRTDSSVVNLGGVDYAGGGDGLGMRLLYKGLNYVLSAVWDPAAMGGGWDPGADSLDLGLFSLSDTTAIDSAKSLTLVSTTHYAGRQDTLILSFSLPQGNSVGPNIADSLIFLKFSNLAGTPGLPVGLAKEKVQVSLDGITYYNAAGVSTITSADEDSVWIASPINLDATSAAKTVYVKFLNFMNPTVANVDSVEMYPAAVKTEATPVLHSMATFFDGQVVADSTAKLLVITEWDTLKIAYPRWESDIVNVTSAVPLTAGTASASWKILQVDPYGNIRNDEAGLTEGGTKKLVFVGMDSTSTGNDTQVKQTLNNVVTNGSGNGMYDTLTVTIDTAYTAGSKGLFADSVQVTLYNNNLATAYYLKVMDTTMTERDSVLVNVAGGAVASLTVDPDSNMVSEREAALPTLSITAKDGYGNPVASASVTIARTYGANGAFTDTNGVAVTSGVDTVTIKTGATGTATAVFTAGADIDSVALKVSATGAADKYFTASLQTAVLDMIFTVTSPADSLEPSLAVAGTIAGSVSDGNDVAEVWVNVWRSELVQNSEMTFGESEATEILKAASATASSDQVTFSLAIGDTADVDTAVVIRYQLVGVDAIDDTTWGDTMMYVVAPNRGKRNMTADAVNVADVMRLVYLIAIDEIVPTVIDYLGLDLDVDGTFDTPDLLAELAIWRGTGTLLAGAGISEGATAKAELSYEATDKATANLALHLDASDNMNVAVFRIKYDTEKFTFGEAKATERLQGVSVVSDANEQDGIYTIVLINTEGGQIVKGSGAILNIQVSAVGEKFDGVGEISLLNASFDEGVAAEISREVLSPKALLPKAFALSQNYPNPFNPSTTIAYDIPEGDNVQVQLNIYNMRGQLVRTLVDEAKSEGSYQIQWDGSDNYGRKVASGVFFYRIKAGEFSQTRKMVILK